MRRSSTVIAVVAGVVYIGYGGYFIGQARGSDDEFTAVSFVLMTSLGILVGLPGILSHRHRRAQAQSGPSAEGGGLYKSTATYPVGYGDYRRIPGARDRFEPTENLAAVPAAAAARPGAPNRDRVLGFMEGLLADEEDPGDPPRWGAAT